MPSTQVNLLKGSILKTMISFALPFLISNIFQQLYNTVDTIIVGYCLGDVSLAAIGASTSIYNLLIGFALGIGNGMSLVSGRMSCLVNMGSLVMQYAINKLGYMIIAGNMAAKKLFSFTVMPLSTMCMSLSTFVAQNKGADQGYRIRKAVRYANIISLVWSVFITIIVFFTAPTMVKLLTGSKEMTVINYGSNFIRIVTPFYLVLGPLFNIRYALQGIGKKVLPLVSSIIELVGKIIFTFLIFPFTGYMGIIFCEPVIWCFMLIQLLIAFYRDPYIRMHRCEKKEIHNI
jgi:Na+-driven multidrug efflux pump